MDRFREALEDCDLSDLGFEGDPFTWRNNSHTSVHYIREHLERVVANNEWMMRFPLHRVINGEPRHSNHRMVIVDTNPPRSDGGRRGPLAFYFEASWVEEDECATIVENAWRTSMVARGDDVGGTVLNVTRELGEWGRNVLGGWRKILKRQGKL